MGFVGDNNNNKGERINVKFFENRNRGIFYNYWYSILCIFKNVE
jgi:hypothetical protein